MKTFHRFVSLIIILCLVVTGTACAADYTNTIETIWSNYASGNVNASSSEQLVNGTYRSFEMLYVIDSMLDDGSMTDQLNIVWNEYESTNASAASVTDQAANGAYRTFEAAYLLALAADSAGSFSTSLNNVWSSYEKGNAAATSASQRLVNGSYRTFEAFYILAQILDSNKEYSKSLKSIWNSYSSENSAAKSSAAQAANGFCRAFEACYIVASLLDTQYLYTESLDDLWNTYESTHSKADSYIKMQINGSYRTFEALYIIAMLLNGDTQGMYMPEVITPANGEVLIAPDYTCTCPLQVTAPRALNAYVYLRYTRSVTASSTKRERVSGASSPYESDIAFYVRAGKTVELDVPVGQYKVYYALGTDFYGTEYLFGEYSYCYAVTDQASFYTDGYYANGNTFNLDGASEVTTISMDNFPTR